MNEIYRREQTVRGPLLPFDEITMPESIQNRSRNIQALIAYLPAMMAETLDYKKAQKQRLTLLQKVNDPCYERVVFSQTVINKIEKFSNKLQTFRPEQTIILIWNFLMLVAVGYNFLEIPLSLFLTHQVYQFQKQNQYFLGLNIFFLLLLFLDTFFIRFNLVFYRHGKLITFRSQIFFAYLRSTFFFDLMAWLVYLFYITLDDPDLIFLKLFFYLKLPQLIQINNQIIDRLSQHKVRCCIYKIFRLIVLLWFFTTWVSSIYFYMDYKHYREKDYYYQTGQLWLTNSNSINNYNVIQTFPKWYYWYEFAVYWSFQTSATVGYGDITPRNPQQVLYCNFIIFINTVFFAFYINTVWSIISQLQQHTDIYTKNWENLRSYINNKEISQSLKDKVGNFLQQKWIHESQDLIADEEESFIEELSEQLRLQLYVGMKGRVLKNGFGDYFKLNELINQWDEIIQHLVFGIEEQKFGSDSIVYQLGDQSDNLYYLIKGKMSLAVSQLAIGKFTSNSQTFGQLQFITRIQHQQTAKTESPCSFQVLPYSFFISSLKRNEVLFNKFCQIRENIFFYNKNQIYVEECLKCNEITHHYRHCPELCGWRNKIARPVYGYRKITHSQKMQRKQKIRVDLKTNKIKGLSHKNEQKALDIVKIMRGYRQMYNLQ